MEALFNESHRLTACIQPASASGAGFWLLLNLSKEAA